MTRRDILAGTAAAGATAALAAGDVGTGGRTAVIPDLRKRFASAIPIRSVEAVQAGSSRVVRVTAKDGSVGLAPDNGRLLDALSLLKRRVGPFFVGRDARDLDTLVDEVYTWKSNYKFAGMPFWGAVAHVELAVWDLLGRLAGLPVGALLGKVRRAKVAVYLSRFNRDNTARAEVAAVAKAVEKYGASAVKLKIGRRMHNTPAQTKRDCEMIRLARKTLGEGVTVYVDANGSYQAGEAIEMGRFLQDQGVGFFEEPCPWQEYDQTRRVAEALTMTVAGGEQDSSLAQWRWMVAHRCVDLVQPDVYYNGGLIRALRVARWADAAGLPITPHSPKTGVQAAANLHFASVAANLGPHQEYREAREVRGGSVSVPKGPGLAGLEPGKYKDARVL